MLPVAVIGMACRVPGAGDYNAFWTNLRNAENLIREIPADRWDVQAYDPTFPDAERVRAARWGGLLDRVDLFDNRFFGISAREARSMDPQQRLLLEESWHCLEDAGISLDVLRSRVTSVHVGVMTLDYHQNVTSAGTVPDSYACLGNLVGILANRVSNFYGWRGESFTLDAACAGSLTALHQARRSLLAGECDFALVAGVSLIINPWHYISFARSRMLSPDGECRTFDRDANGYVPGEGVVTLLLCREEDARRLNARVHGRVLGTATSHVGPSDSITAPSVAAQRGVIRQAIASAGIDAATISYVEAHGTGTPLGDPIEVTALGEALAVDGGRSEPIWVGSAKTSIGHLEAAAGLAGVAKVLLMMRHRTIAPTRNLHQVNPLIDFTTGPLRPALEPLPWQAPVLRAGVSAFGFGGTNAHAILEAAADDVIAEPAPVLLPFVLSAASAASFQALWARWREFVASPAFQSASLPDILATAACGRPGLSLRFAQVVADRDALRDLLAGPAPEPTAVEQAPAVMLRVGDDAPSAIARAGILGLRPVAVTGGEPAGSSCVLYDPERRTLSLPWALDATYLAALRAGFQPIAPDDLDRLLERSRGLAVSNFTFRGYLDDWRRALGDRGDLYRWIETPPVDPTDRALLGLCLAASCRRLVQRWKLSALPDVQSEPVAELARLCADGLVREREAIALLSDDPTHLPALVPAIAARMVRVEQAIDYPILCRHSADRHAVIETMDPPATLVVDAAYLPDPGSGASVDLHHLAELWQAGVAVDWSALTPSYRVQSLPLYPFDGQRHWIDLPSSAPAALDDDQVEPADPTPEETPGPSDLLGQVDAYAARRLFVVLDRAGALTPLGIGMTRADIARRCLRLPGYRGLLEACLDILGRHGLTANAEGRVRAVTDRAAAATVASALRDAMAAADPDMVRLLDAIDTCVGALPSVLAGDRPAEDVLFPAGDTRLVETLLSGDPDAAVALRQTAEAVVQSVQAWLEARPGQRVRVLEVGAGTGLASEVLLSALAPFATRITYACTDRSVSILAAARDRLGAQPVAVEFHRLDLDDPVAPDDALGRFDIVVAVNTLHALASPSQGLRHLRERLGRQGVLIVNEPDGTRDAMAVTLGLLARWWLPDPAQDRASPSAAQAPWDRIIADHRFTVQRQSGPHARAVLVARAIDQQEVSVPVSPPPAATPPAMSEAVIESLLPSIREAIVRAADADPSRIGDDTQFVVLGVDSLAAADFTRYLGDALGRPVPPHVVDDHPTPRRLARYLAEQVADAEAVAVAAPATAIVLPDPEPVPVAAVPSMAGTVRSWTVSRVGELDSLTPVEVPRTAPGAGQVAVDIDASSLNFRDVMQALGRLDGPPRPLGLEFAGRVAAVGAGVTGLVPGQPVLGIGPGSLARHVVTSTDLVVPRPDGLSAAQAASLPIVFLTAAWTLERIARLGSGQKVLIHAATGGVGLAALQIAQQCGATVLATAGSEEKRAYLRDLGIACVADSRDPGFADVVRQATGGAGVDVVLNCLAGAMTDAGLALVRPGGIFIEIGKTDIRDAATVARQHPRIRYTVFDLLGEVDRDPALVGRRLRALLDRFTSGALQPIPVRAFPYEDAAAGLRFLARARHIGKVVLSEGAVAEAPVVETRREPQPAPIPAPAVTPAQPVAANEPIAIVGMAGRFPGAPDLAAFWRLLRDGVDAIGTVPQDRWHAAEFAAHGVGAANPSLTAGGFLEDAESFDSAFFGISPREALLIDPQQRVILEQTWLALVDAGLRPREDTAEPTGVFIGASASDYAQKGALLGLPIDRPSLLAQMPSTLSARLGYVFDLKGPALTVDMGCASAVAAIKLAVDALRRGEVDLAIAGAVAVQSTPQLAIMAEQGGVLAPDGRCRSFSADAGGIGLSEGVGVVVLRRLGDARARGDAVHAVIRAVAISQNGMTNGLSAPSVAAQTTLARRAMQAADIAPGSISFVEAHGVGTRAGDAAEVTALAEVFGTGRTLPIGSVKSNIGHTLAAAGMAGLFKIVLQMRHGSLVPSLHAQAPLPELAGKGLAVNTGLVPWPAAGTAPRRAALNAFAINGSNGFMVVEEAAAQERAVPQPAQALLLLADRSQDALRQRLADLAGWLDVAPVELADLAATLNTAPAGLPWRAAFVATDVAGFRQQLRAAAQGGTGAGWYLGQARDQDPETRAVFADMAVRLCQPVPDAQQHRKQLLAVARLFVDGQDISVPAPAGGRRVGLVPSYRFDRQRFWPDAPDRPIPPVLAPSVPAIAPPPLTGNAETPAVAVEAPDPVLAILREEAAAVLRLPPHAIDSQAVLPRLGLDSLLAFELRARLTRVLDAVPDPALLLSDRSLADLARDIMPGATATTRLEPDNAGRFEPFPLTDIQLAYWLGRTSRFALGGACHVYWEFAAGPDRDPDRLQAAFNRLIAQHDMLRAVVQSDGTQRVLAEVPPYLIARHDWRGDDQAERHRENLRAAMTRETFDPTRWPLFRVAFSRDDVGTRIHLGVDLLIIDVPSLALLLGQWRAVYEDAATVLPPPAISFRDYVHHLRRQEETPAWRAARDYWARLAPTLPPAPRLPDMKPLDARPDWAWTRHHDVLGTETWAALRQRARAEGVTPVAVLVSAFAEVLARWAIERRFTVNLTVNDRQPVHPDIGAVVGDFTSTILLGLDLGMPMPFAARVRATGSDLATHLSHASFTGVRVAQQRGNGGGDGALMPVVFTSMLGYAALSGPIGRLDHGATRTPQVWLDAQVMEDDGALVVTWDSIDALFPDGLLGGMFAAWVASLRALSRDAAVWTRPLSTWLAEAEQGRRRRRNATDHPVVDGLLHEPFLRQALAQPDRVAVIGPDGTVTYGALLRQALAIAAQLGDVAPDRLVAVSLPKGWRQVAAAIGVLLAGGAYLPIETSLPRARRHHLLARGEATTVLTLAQAAQDWPADIRVIAVDRLDPAPLPSTMPARKVAPTDLAYVIFTSGSTGEPKGVMIEHRAALNTVLDCNDRFAVGPDDRVLGLSALSFDLSVYDIFGVLGAGGAVVLPDPRSAADPAHLAGLLRDHGVTIWNSVPMFVQLFLEGTAGAADLAGLRLVMMSGDWIPIGLPPRLHAANPALRVVSLGGATEASIWSIAYDVGAPDPAWTSIPYGFPMRNQRFHVLDEQLADSPDWVAGELFIAGVGLARGYWRAPEITRERFITHPVTGERLYRTGDLGRYRDDGVIEFLGRNDGQVKIGGYRIELGEIEVILSRHPAIRQAAVVVRTGADGHRSLAAFYVADAAADPGAEALRAHAAASLPAYMVPPALQRLDAMPLNANEKLDRKALANWQAPAAPVVATPVPAAGPRAEELEAGILAIWRDVLGNPLLPADGKLFEHGAHSFHAVDANARINRTFAVGCTVTDIFEFATVRALAQALAARHAHSQPPPPSPDPLPERLTEPPRPASTPPAMTRVQRRRQFRTGRPV